jgi:hypothetical protein
LKAAFEARHPTLQPKRDVRFGGDWLLGRIDGQPHLGRAVVGDPPDGEAIGITLAGDDE